MISLGQHRLAKIRRGAQGNGSHRTAHTPRILRSARECASDGTRRDWHCLDSCSMQRTARLTHRLDTFGAEVSVGKTSMAHLGSALERGGKHTHRYATGAAEVCHTSQGVGVDSQGLDAIKSHTHGPSFAVGRSVRKGSPSQALDYTGLSSTAVQRKHTARPCVGLKLSDRSARKVMAAHRMSRHGMHTTHSLSGSQFALSCNAADCKGCASRGGDRIYLDCTGLYNHAVIAGREDFMGFGTIYCIGLDSIKQERRASQRIAMQCINSRETGKISEGKGEMWRGRPRIGAETHAGNREALNL